MDDQGMEIERLRIDKERLEIDRAKAVSETRFFNRHLGAIISLLAVFVSMTQVFTAYLIAQNQFGLESRRVQSDEKRNQADILLTAVSLLTDPDPKKKEYALATLTSIYGDDKTAEILNKVLQHGPAEARGAAVEGIQNIRAAELVPQYNLEAWNGTWNYDFKSSKGSFTGSMTLASNPDGSVAGSYTNANKSNGNIQGRLLDDGRTLDGFWNNSVGQSGRLVFVLSRDTSPITFAGRYSMLGEIPKEGSPLTWTGRKTN